VENEVPGEEFTEKDKELEIIFIKQSENLIHSSTLQMEPREKLPKVKLETQLRESANRILDIYLKGVDSIPDISDKVYSMGRAIRHKLGVLIKVDESRKTKKAGESGGNRQERKLKKEIKELRQVVAKASNELYRRKQHRKATKKEKKNLKELRAKSQKDTTNHNLRNAREQ